MSTQRRMIASFVGVTLLLLCACQSAVSSPATGKAAATATPPRMTKLNLAYSNLTRAILPMWVAEDAGIFGKNGLDVSLQFITGSAALPALTSGRVQVAFMGSTEMLNGDLSGANVVAFMDESIRPPYVMSVSSGINSVDDLKGKKIGISSFGSSSDTTTRQVLQAEGIQPSDVTFVAVGSPPARASALITGAIQGALTTPPDSYQLNEHGVKNLFDVSTLDLPPNAIPYAARGSYIAEHDDVVQRFTNAIIEAEIHEKNNKSFAVSELEKYLKNNDAQVMSQTYDYYVPSGLIRNPLDIAASQFGAAVDEVAATNTKAKTFDVAKIVDDSFVKNAVAKGLSK